MISLTRQARSLPTLLCSRCHKHSLSTAASPRKFDILFFGSDKFSCIVFQKLVDEFSYSINNLSVVTPADAFTGKGLKTVSRPALRTLAESLSKSVTAWPHKANLQVDDIAPLLAPSSATPVLVTASFGHLIPTSILDLFPPKHVLNCHPSFLPQLRGAAPIQWAIARGLKQTGISVQTLSKGKFDQGLLLGQQQIDMPDNVQFDKLLQTLATANADLLMRILTNFNSAKAHATNQTGAVSHARKVTKADVHIDWTSITVDKLERYQLAFAHQLPLWCNFRNSRLQFFDLTHDLHPHQPLNDEFPGTAYLDKDHHLIVKAKDGHVKIKELKMAGKNRVPAKEWWNGYSKGERTLHLQ